MNKKTGCDRLRSIDLFGVPVSFVYRGETTFSTRVGGIFSLLWAILVIGVFSQDAINFIVFGDGLTTELSTELSFYDSAVEKKEFLDSNYTMMGRLFANYDISAA